MKTALKVSLLLNLSLGGCLVFSLLAVRPAVAPSPSSAVATAPPAVVATVADAPPAPFRWSRLESDDYRVYVKNLRGVGCPEPVLRAIVTADVHAVYGRRGRALEQQLAAMADAAWSARPGDVGTEQALRAEMLAQPDAEAAEIAELLGLKPVPVAAAPSPPVLHKRPSPEDLPPAMPLVLQDIDLTPLGLNDDQKQAVADLRQNFLAEIGGANQDPDDPAYLARWQKAQPEVDGLLQAMLGGKIYTEYQMLADNQAAAEPAHH